MREILQEAGYAAYATPQGLPAQELIDIVSPQLVLLDIRLSTQHPGQALLHQLEPQACAKTLKVMLCTTDLIGAPDANLWKDYEDFEIIRKPFILETLLERIAVTLNAPQRHPSAPHCRCAG